MVDVNVRPSSRAAIVGVLDPKSQGAGARSTGWISMQKFPGLLALINVGVMGALATVDAKIEQATDSAGTGVKDLSPAKAITQLVATGSPTVDNDNRQVEINVKDTDLDFANNFAYARLTVTVGVANTLTSANVLGFDPAEGPASDNDLASVAQIV